MSISSKVLTLEPLMAALLLDKTCNSVKFIAILFSLTIYSYNLCYVKEIQYK